MSCQYRQIHKDRTGNHVQTTTRAAPYLPHPITTSVPHRTSLFRWHSVVFGALVTCRVPRSPCCGARVTSPPAAPVTERTAHPSPCVTHRVLPAAAARHAAREPHPGGDQLARAAGLRGVVQPGPALRLLQLPVRRGRRALQSILYRSDSVAVDYLLILHPPQT